MLSIVASLLKCSQQLPAMPVEASQKKAFASRAEGSESRTWKSWFGGLGSGDADEGQVLSLSQPVLFPKLQGCHSHLFLKAGDKILAVGETRILSYLSYRFSGFQKHSFGLQQTKI